MILNKPYKVIWKYKNDNKFQQYHIYIFVGNISKQISDILDKIEKLNLFESLIQLNNDEIQILIKQYGEFWYKYFFNMYHCLFIISHIKHNETMTNDLKIKFGNEWFDNHIKITNIIEKTIYYSYSILIGKESKIKTKKQRLVSNTDDIEDVNYKLGKTVNLQTIISKNAMERYEIYDWNKGKYKQVGGYNQESQENQENLENHDDNLNDDYDEPAITDDPTDINEIAEIEDLYKYNDVELDDDAKNTSKLIKSALDNNELYETIDKNKIKFDQSNDSAIYAQKLKDVFLKIYIKTQFIFTDDTIKTVKHKICCSLLNNEKFGKIPYVIPSRQYLWTERINNEVIEKSMIGQKWLKNSTILDIDHEPDNRLYLYEQLNDVLGALHSSLKKYGNRIRCEDDENNILYNYNNYITNNDIYMIDIYNELGKNYTYKMETLKNLEDIYIKLYYPKLKRDDIVNIIKYLNNEENEEETRINNVYEAINNDLIIENEIMNLVESVKSGLDHNKLIDTNYVTHSVIHLNIRTENNKPIDMYRLFNEFIVDNTYPFVQYQTNDHKGEYKYNEEFIYKFIQNKSNIGILYKWFETIPYGISFKLAVSENRFISISLSDIGRIEYKIQWKEIDMATIHHINETYNYVRNLINKISKESPKNTLISPIDDEFKYAFISTIQKFDLPGEHIINHNDLSDFARFFFPYVALVIEPRKRNAIIVKAVDNSKFGTYLRFKRMAKYDNIALVEQRIIYFLRNYVFNDAQLAIEIAKQFNMTENTAANEIKKTRDKYPKLKKSRNELKTFEKIPKYKPPGINIDILGKSKDKYKIRVTGARDKDQVIQIILFVHSMIQLYIETYLYKNKDRIYIRDKLDKLLNIAKRRSKVNDFVDYTKEVKTIKQITKLDKQRIGFKPSIGVSQWSRSCQNSGTEKKRRPQQYNLANINKLSADGYVYNKKLDNYEKVIKYKKKEIVLTTLKVPELDETSNPTGNFIYYACDPKENGEHMYVGFLTRSMNPNGQCMPCCFKIDPAVTSNKAKKEFFKNCLNKTLTDAETSQKISGDKLYILQDTNKVQEGRYATLPNFLDIYFNKLLGNSKQIKIYYLEHTNGYFFKYGINQSEYQFLNAICATLKMDIATIKNKIIEVLEKDQNDQIFTSLNDGEIRIQYETREKYIKYIQTSQYLDYPTIKSIICIPGVISKHGLNIIIFHKKIITIKKTLEKDTTIDDFYIECVNNEIDTITNPKYTTIILIKEDNMYYPVVLVTKKNKQLKTIETEFTYQYNNNPKNIVHHMLDFINKNCSNSTNILYANTTLTAKNTVIILKQLDKKYHPRYQIIDTRYKCKYIITASGYIIPVKPSGAIWSIQHIKTIDNYISDFDTTYKYLTELYEKSKEQLNILPYGVYYESKNKDIIKINSIITNGKDIIPITDETVDISKIKNMKLIYEQKPLTHKIDKEISKGPTNYKIDDRITKVNENLFIEESYQLFRLEFSNYITKTENENKKKQFEKIMNSSLAKSVKVEKIRLLLYKLIDNTLYEKYSKLTTVQEGGASYSNVLNYMHIHSRPQTGGRIFHIADTMPKLNHYHINNNRDTCDINVDKDVCNNNSHCKWSNNSCFLSLTNKMVIQYINRIADELAYNDVKAYEIMKIGEYYVSDIVDRNHYTHIPGQKIIRESSTNVKNTLSQLFGNNTPTIGKKKVSHDINDDAINAQNSMVNLNDTFIQKIIPNNITIFRAYANSYYWIQNTSIDIISRNLGYYSNNQTNMANYFKSDVIGWLGDGNKYIYITPIMFSNMDTQKTVTNTINGFISKLTLDVSNTSGIVELTILSMLNTKYAIIVRNEYNKIIHIFDKGTHYIEPDNSVITKYNFNNCINIKYEFINNSIIPDNISSIYYR